jgi:ATP-dependent protease ClpP protease subunit
MEFKYTIDPTSANPIMLINDTIGKDGIDGGDFQKELLSLDTMGKESIEIMINSPGGSVFDGFSIASAIINCKTPVITNNVGVAGSIAGVIWMSAKERLMEDYALFMCHNVQGGDDKARNELDNSISLLLSKNSSLSQETVKKLMAITTWLNYNECYDNGFCTGSKESFVPKMTNVVFTKNSIEDIYEYTNKILINEINMKKETSKKELENFEKSTIKNDGYTLKPEEGDDDTDGNDGDMDNKIIASNAEKKIQKGGVKLGSASEAFEDGEEAEEEAQGKDKKEPEIMENMEDDDYSDEMDDKVNPWAVCSKEVGREDAKKYESCVMKVKKEAGIHAEMTEEDYKDGIKERKAKEKAKKGEMFKDDIKSAKKDPLTAEIKKGQKDPLTAEVESPKKDPMTAEIKSHQHDPMQSPQNLIDEKDLIIRQLQSEIAKMKADMQDKEITNFINEYVELGKITNETKDSWFNLCRTDFESTKDVIKSLNINREAPKFENNSNGVSKTPQTFMEMLSFGRKNK